MVTLSNGVRVASEAAAGGLVGISVAVHAGTRHEGLENSGASQYIKKLVLRGTKSQTREEVEQKLEALGGKLDIRVEREVTMFNLSVPKNQGLAGVAWLCDVVANSTMAQSQMEAEKQAVFLESLNLARDQYAQTMDSAHACSFRDHFLGQPLMGIRDNLHNVTADQVQAFHKQNYVGTRTVVSVAGGDHSQAELVDTVDKALGSLAKEGSSCNGHQAEFTPSTMFIRDDEMNNINCGVFFKAPSYDSPEYFQLRLLQKIMGEFQADQFTGKWLNSPDKQYSIMHSQLGLFPDITLHKCDYITYQDTALFGSYLMGNEVFAAQLQYMSQFVLTEYASHVPNVELIRAKNQSYTALLRQAASAPATAQAVARQVLYHNRRVSPNEEASRLAAIDTETLQRTVSRVFYDKDLTMTVWGPVGHCLGGSIYRREVQRSSLGWLGASQYSAM